MAEDATANASTTSLPISFDGSLAEIEKKKLGNRTIRYVSFNVNGVKTLFNYNPWNKLKDQDLDAMFCAMDADIITLQELKLSQGNISTVSPGIGHLKNYKSFISLPVLKRGYSGVGLFVRIPTTGDPPQVKKNLTVVKAEQGVTGYLSCGDSNYREMPDTIGGYPEAISASQGLSLDSEGRCVVIELACNLVVFALYCPANSMATEAGEEFRLSFLSALFTRCYNLTKMGKKVLVMGDINVALDLIDHADTINELQKASLIPNVIFKTGTAFESANYEQCIDFKSSTPARQLLNKYVWPSLKYDMVLKPNLHCATQFLYDTTRYWQGRRMNMYTVWNTLTNSRAVNYGSRIDLCLISCPEMLASISNANIWPTMLGSDHCPTFTDFDILDTGEAYTPTNIKLDFEAKYMYKLFKARDIASLFGPAPKKQKPAPKDQVPLAGATTTKHVYVSRKSRPTTENQKSIKQFFNSNITTSPSDK